LGTGDFPGVSGPKHWSLHQNSTPTPILDLEHLLTLHHKATGAKLLFTFEGSTIVTCFPKIESRTQKHTVKYLYVANKHINQHYGRNALSHARGVVGDLRTGAREEIQEGSPSGRERN
jgi:hypothetical protein